MKCGFGREQNVRRIHPEGVADDAPVPLDLPHDVALGDQRHQRVEEAEGGEVAARMAERRLLPRDGAQGAVPAAEAPTAPAVAGAAVELLEQRAAPARRQAGVRQAALDVLPDSRRDEVGVVAAARAEDAVFLAVPIIRVGGIVIRLVHVLVDAEVQPHLRGVRADGGPWRAQGAGRRLTAAGGTL